MTKTLLAMLAIPTFAILMSQSAWARTVYVSGHGAENSFCNANSGYFCFDNIKRRAISEGERDTRWTCEMNQRGRSLTYTLSCNTYCSPSYLPPNHDGTWVNCRSDCRMQCEVQD
ncbi:hypothetical protein QJS83_11900 [Bdellovibrio sp. 22V]|uniref:hypothetical protein n=1 Tax=Bdellovibrio TaxID=958 RepID=UPI002542F163|nr:hypothetical protein [Bdellovibrio sp. 22V]WII71163.1 hypothetical protein QJS83_11900 [Bdellovibrio sp. 22V]